MGSILARLLSSIDPRVTREADSPPNACAPLDDLLVSGVDMSDENYFSAMNSLMGYLARRDHSVKELRDKLKRKFTVEEVDRALETAHENGWLIPPEELAVKVAGELGRKGKGKIYIRNYLAQKGLPLVTADDEEELQKGMEVARHKFGEGRLEQIEERKKVYQFLINRGFDSFVARKVSHEEL